MSIRLSLNEKHNTVVNELSDLILFHLHRAAQEQYAPSSPADCMDALITDHKNRAAKLRKLREEFEDAVSGVIGEVL